MNPDTERDYRAVAIFRTLAEDVLARVAAHSYLQTFPPEVTLLVQGRRPDFVHGVVTGHVELASSEADQTATLVVIEAGEIVPAGALVSPTPSPYSARTLSRSRIVMTPVPVLRSLMDEVPHFTLELLRASDSANRHLMRELHNRNLRKPHQRIAHWIRMHASESAGQLQVEMPYPKKILASVLGMSLATLSRDIETLESHGVSFEGRSIVIRDPQALEALALHCPTLDS